LRTLIAGGAAGTSLVGIGPIGWLNCQDKQSGTMGRYERDGELPDSLGENFIAVSIWMPNSNVLLKGMFFNLA